MTSSPHNPPTAAGVTPPSKALRIARLMIAVGLCVGIAVFAFLSIESLRAGQQQPALPTDFGKADTSTAAPATVSLTELTATDPNKFIPIRRANPHPGEMVPFLNAAPLGQVPYRQPTTGGEVWELCAYQVSNASLTDLFLHYEQQALQRGMKKIKKQPTSEQMPGGVAVAWGGVGTRLEVTARPLPSVPTNPPLAPQTPLRWVVKYSYPDRPVQP